MPITVDLITIEKKAVANPEKMARKRIQVPAAAPAPDKPMPERPAVKEPEKASVEREDIKGKYAFS